MHCQYCGKEIGVSAWVRDDHDFCSPNHRERFHARLIKGMRRVEESELQPKGLPSFQLTLHPCLSPAALSTAPPVEYPQMLCLGPRPATLRPAPFELGERQRFSGLPNDSSATNEAATARSARLNELASRVKRLHRQLAETRLARTA